MNASRLTGFRRLLDLKDYNDGNAMDMNDKTARFDRLRSPGSAPRVVSSFNLFQTPPELATRLAGEFQSFGRTLEPSAGLGRLYKAVRAVSACDMTLVDISPDCCAELNRIADTATVLCGDFLDMRVDQLGYFDSIIMNPPFKQGADIRHIKHALTMLAGNGRLVSLVAAGPRQRAALEDMADSWVDLPVGSFKSEGTNVNSAIVTFSRKSC